MRLTGFECPLDIVLYKCPGDLLLRVDLSSNIVQSHLTELTPTSPKPEPSHDSRPVLQYHIHALDTCNDFGVRRKIHIVMLPSLLYQSKSSTDHKTLLTSNQLFK